MTSSAFHNNQLARTRCNTLNTLQHIATLYTHYRLLFVTYSAFHHNQHTATRCNTLQQTATLYNILQALLRDVVGLPQRFELLLQIGLVSRRNTGVLQCILLLYCTVQCVLQCIRCVAVHLALVLHCVVCFAVHQVCCSASGVLQCILLLYALCVALSLASGLFVLR